MPENVYAAEIAALIAGKIYANPEHLFRINALIEREQLGTTLHSICAEAASIFDDIELLLKNTYANPLKASETYADSLLDVLLSGKVPNHMDMVVLTAQSLQDAT